MLRTSFNINIRDSSLIEYQVECLRRSRGDRMLAQRDTLWAVSKY